MKTQKEIIPCLGHKCYEGDYDCDYLFAGEIDCGDCICNGGKFDPRTGKTPKKPRSPRQLQGDKIAALLHEKFPYYETNFFIMANKILKLYNYDSVRVILETMPCQQGIAHPLSWMLAKCRNEIKYPKQQSEVSNFLAGFSHSHRMQ